MSIPKVIKKDVRDLTVFQIARANRKLSQRAVANALGMSPGAYARIEEGVYEISGLQNNPKVVAIANYYDIPVEVAEEEAHKNLVSGWHPAMVKLNLHNGTHAGAKGSRERGSNAPLNNLVEFNQIAINSLMESVDIEDEEQLVNYGEHDVQCTLDVYTAQQKDDIVASICKELYGDIDYAKYNRVVVLLNQLLELGK